ncbi:hypothetical protein F5883DRAFT_3308 [Diaporthe sp. PMI_573]|nr:hypothetical protein F5883DRAFT_3308 [Diaporthaceae sp. PMI_573]
MTHQLPWNRGRGANEPHPCGLNVLHEAVIHRNEEVLDYMMSSGYRLETLINSRASDGNTPLHYYATTCVSSIGIFHKLLSLNPDLNVTNNDSLRPIECLIDKENVFEAVYLLRRGSRPYQVIRSILLASGRCQPKMGLYSGLRQQWVQARNELVLTLIDHALDTGRLTRDVEQDHLIGVHWSYIFQLACTQPSLLQELLRAGFRPKSLTGGYPSLLLLLEVLARSRMDDDDMCVCYEAIRMLTRAGERWDRRGTQGKTPLEHLVKDSGSLRPEIREALFSNLLGSRPPEETGAEQAHLNHLCRYALDRGDTQTYQYLVRHGAKDPSVY